MTVIIEPDYLNVTPADGLTFSGTAGGPISPAYRGLLLENTDTIPTECNAVCSESWLSIDFESGVLNAGESIVVEVALTEEAYELPAGPHSADITLNNLTTGVSIIRKVTLELILADFYTELFDEQDNDLSNQSLTFVPNGSSSFYWLCRVPATEFPTDPTGGTVVFLADDGYQELALADDAGYLLSFWLEFNCDAMAGDSSDWCFGADLDRSGGVNWRDFAVLAGYWLEETD